MEGYASVPLIRFLKITAPAQVFMNREIFFASMRYVGLVIAVFELSKHFTRVNSLSLVFILPAEMFTNVNLLYFV